MSDRLIPVEDGEMADNDSLPCPIVLYPSHYGTFIGFKRNQDDEVHFCSCSKDAVSNYLRATLGTSEATQQTPTVRNILSGDFPIETQELAGIDDISSPEQLSDILNFSPGLCHMCNTVVPERRYCHEMYGTVFEQNYGWYVNQNELEFGLSSDVGSAISLSPRLLDSIPEDVVDTLDIESKGEIEDLLLQYEKLYSKRRDRQSTLQTIQRAKENEVREARQSGELTDDQARSRRATISKKYDLELVLNDQETAELNQISNTLEKIQQQISDAAENEVRRSVGHYEKGNRWTNETILYQLIKSKYGDRFEIRRHYRPDWLDGLELDIFLVEPQIGIEYQGIQHYEPVEHWGGREALKERQARDRRTRKLCTEHGVELVEIKYSEELSEELVSSRISPLIR